MKYLLLICVLFIISCLVYAYLLAVPEPAAYTNALSKQQNSFVVHKDSAAIVWSRARQYVIKNGSLLSGGTLQVQDSILYLPYYNDHKKGNSIRIEKHAMADSVRFLVQWWYSENLQEKSGRVLALYMQHQLDKKDFE